jgi:hypothetical protein
MATFRQKYCSLHNSVLITIIWVYVDYVHSLCVAVNPLTGILKCLGKKVGRLVLRGKGRKVGT